MKACLNVSARLLASAAAVLALVGCASTAIESNLSSARALAKDGLGADLRWLTSVAARKAARVEVDRLLSRPLSADDAVRIALAHSPALQAMLFDSAAASAAATEAARLPNPVFAFERLVHQEGGRRDIDINRMLSVSVFDLLLLPARLRQAELQQQQVRMKLGGDVVQAALDARQAWVRAVAAAQSMQHFEHVTAVADTSAELAGRMQAVGNINRLQRAHEQLFSAQAGAQLARSQQAAASAREALVRTLGLNPAQARSLMLTDRLPDLPTTARREEAVLQVAIDQRLDVRMARAELELAASSQGLTRVTRFVDGFRVAALKHREGGHAWQKGFEVELPLPLFDFSDAANARAQAVYMAALFRAAQLGVDAASQVREAYGVYRTAYDVARRYRDEIVPLRKTIAEDNLLRYESLRIDVFEVLAGTREQIGSVVEAIDAQRDFWLADAALQGALIGKPVAGVRTQARADSMP